jgi:hypothetical protein
MRSHDDQQLVNHEIEQHTTSETEEVYRHICSDANRIEQAFDAIVCAYEDEALQDLFEEENPTHDRHDIWRDLMTAAISRVDWQLIVDRLRAKDAEIEEQTRRFYRSLDDRMIGQG